MSKKNKDNNLKISYIFTRETIGLTVLLFSAIVLLMLFTRSTVFAGIGTAVCTLMYGTFGYGAFLVMALTAYLGEWLTFEKKLKISFRKALTISLTVFTLFLLFHAVSTRNYALENYGSYISLCYTNAQNGISGYTFGGVISALIVYPVAKVGGFVTAYVIFSILSILFGYLAVTSFIGKHAKRERVVAVEDGDTESVSTNTVEAKEPVSVRTVHEQQPQPLVQTKQQPEEDKFSQKNLGRKIIFEKGEFAAESYRRNMIFNENSYFNHPTTSEADYLSSFSIQSKPKKTENKSYSESYREDIYNQTSGAMPNSYVYGEKPVEDINVYSAPAKSVYESQSEHVNPYSAEEEYGQFRHEPVQPDYTDDDPYTIKDEEPSASAAYYAQEIQETKSVEPAADEIFRREEPAVKDEPVIPPVRERGRTFEAATKEVENYRSAIDGNSSEEKDDVYDFLSGNSQTERSVRSERSNANLFDDDAEGDGVLSSGRRGIEKTPRSVRREVSKTVETQKNTGTTPVEQTEEKPKHVWKKYVRPPIDLLVDYPENNNVNTGEIEDNKRIIVETLMRFKIASDVANVTIGPSITRYDVIIEDKTNIRKALGYRDAIAMELRKDNVNAYLNYSKGAISIEVPNNKRATVGLKTMLTSSSFINCKQGSLTFAFGKNVDGEVVCPDITKMPHLLVAGTTGSGKSICLSALLVSLLYKYGPEELRLILVDPKQVEFISYDKLPHLMINEIIYECDKAIKALNWAIKEMERRYSLFKDMTEAGMATKNLDEYNENIPAGEEKLPKIVIILDEFGDLMLQAKKDIESRIIKLVQKARACGIHLILATQRPSVDCITGLIKSNLPTRIGFKVNSFDDSRCIFDIGGAEKLLGKGDSFFRSADNPDLARIQGCFVDSKEVQKVTDFVKANNETYFDQSVSDFINTVEQTDERQNSMSGDGDEAGETKIDDTFIKALKYCVTSNQASVSMIQRRFPIGYIKACKIIDWMENMNYVTPSEGSKSRKVLLSKEEFFNIYGEIDD